MFKFLAMRIHNGFMTINDVPSKSQEAVKKAYKELYGEDI